LQALDVVAQAEADFQGPGRFEYRLEGIENGGSRRAAEGKQVGLAVRRQLGQVGAGGFLALGEGRP